MPSAPHPGLSLYGYQPTMVIAIVAAVGSVLIALAHIWQLMWHRAWMCWALLVGLLMNCAGLIARVDSVRDPASPNPFIFSYLALILAPSFVAAACYITFGRILWYVTPLDAHTLRVVWCPTRFITAIFVIFDLVSFAIQFLGAAAVGSAYSDRSQSPDEQQQRVRRGLTALKGGLGLQLACFALFAVVGARFIVVSRRWSGRPLRYPASPGASWVRLMWAVNISAAAVVVRAIYRLFEFSRPRNHTGGYLQRHEWPFWVFDALPMLGIFCLFAVVHPGQHLPKQFLSLRLDKRRLRNEAKSSPPSYSIALEGGSGV